MHSVSRNGGFVSRNVRSVTRNGKYFDAKKHLACEINGWLGFAGTLINLYSSPVNMVFEVCIYQILVNTEIKLIRQEEVVYFYFEAEQIVKAQVLSHQSDINIRKRLVAAFGSRAEKDSLLNMGIVGENRKNFLPFLFFQSILFHDGLYVKVRKLD